MQQRKQREREKITGRRELRVTYDLPPLLRAGIRTLAEELRIPASQLVALAIARFLTDYKNKLVDLGKYKKPSRSPRYDWNLDLAELLISMKRKVNSFKSLK